MDAIYYGFAVLLFAAVILLVEGCYLWWNSTHGGEAQRISRRLRLMSGGAEGGNGEVSILKQRRYSKNDGIDRLLHKMRIANAIDRLILQAGVRWSVSQFIVASAAMMLSGLVMVQVWAVPLLGKLIIIALLTAIPYGMLRRARRQRLIKIEQQLPEAADFIARALRSGHSFTNVLQMVGSELPEPLCGEFRAAHEEINYGVPLNEALHNLADRIPLTDLRYLVIAVLIQRESGGNLSEVLGNIGKVVRERLALRGEIATLTSQGKLSARIMAGLPLFVFVAVRVMDPAYMNEMTSKPLGRLVLLGAAASVMVGYLTMMRIADVEV